MFISGATGYLGRALIPELLARGRRVRALVRPGSKSRLPPQCDIVHGNALDASTFASKVDAGSTYVHLVGVPKPAPWKGKQFREIDLVSARESVAAAVGAGVAHFVYVSVAQPAPVMKSYLRVRAECEAMIRKSRLNATILRPWYVLGPGHWWPAALAPIYWLAERIPSTREPARRLGLVTLAQMRDALTWAVMNPSRGVRVMDVPAIRRGR